MNIVERWVMTCIMRKEIKKMGVVSDCITKLYAMIREQAAERFDGATDATLNSYLTECFEKTLVIQNRISTVRAREDTPSIMVL